MSIFKLISIACFRLMYKTLHFEWHSQYLHLVVMLELLVIAVVVVVVIVAILSRLY